MKLNSHKKDIKTEKTKKKLLIREELGWDHPTNSNSLIINKKHQFLSDKLTIKAATRPT